MENWWKSTGRGKGNGELMEEYWQRKMEWRTGGRVLAGKREWRTDGRVLAGEKREVL